MALPKAYELVRVLNPDELRELQQVCRQSKSERPALLISSFENTDRKDFSKEALFKSVYQESYDKSKDYLLRNDLRKLAAIISDFIEKDVVKSKDAYDYFSFLLDRQALGLFDKEVTAHLGLKKEKINIEDLRINDLHIQYVLLHSPRLKKEFEQQIDYISRTLHTIPDTACSDKLKILLHYAKYERIFWQHFQVPFTDLETLLDSSCLEDNPQHQYLFQKAKSFQLFDSNRIEILEECRKTLKSNKNSPKGEIAYILSQLGLEYFLAADYERSYQYYDQTRALEDHLDKHGTLQYIYNFASLLSRMKRFDEVIPLVGEHLVAFEHTPVADNVRIFLFFAYDQAGDLEAMRSMLPDDESGLSKDSKIYWRVLECIMLYSEKELETCITFLENIYQSSRYNTNIDKAFIELSLLFRNFVKACMIIDRADKKSAIEKCLQTSNEFIDRHKLGFGSNMLSSTWLNDEMKRVLGM